MFVAPGQRPPLTQLGQSAFQESPLQKPVEQKSKSKPHKSFSKVSLKAQGQTQPEALSSQTDPSPPQPAKKADFKRAGPLMEKIKSNILFLMEPYSSDSFIKANAYLGNQGLSKESPKSAQPPSSPFPPNKKTSGKAKKDKAFELTKAEPLTNSLAKGEGSDGRFRSLSPVSVTKGDSKPQSEGALAQKKSPTQPGLVSKSSKGPASVPEEDSFVSPSLLPANAKRQMPDPLRERQEEYKRLNRQQLAAIEQEQRFFKSDGQFSFFVNAFSESEKAIKYVQDMKNRQPLWSFLLKLHQDHTRVYIGPFRSRKTAEEFQQLLPQNSSFKDVFLDEVPL